MTPGLINWLVLHLGLLIMAPLVLIVIFAGLRVDSSHPHDES